MSPLLASFSCVSLFAALSAGGQPGVLSDKEIGEIKMKILALRAEIGKLTDQMDALGKRLDQHVKAITKPVEMYVKVEVKGTLRETRMEWWIDVDGFETNGAPRPSRRSWDLDFGDHKDLLELAKEQKGRTVIITGKLVLRHRDTPGGSLFLEIATLKAAGQ